MNTTRAAATAKRRRAATLAQQERIPGDDHQPAIGQKRAMRDHGRRHDSQPRTGREMVRPRTRPTRPVAQGPAAAPGRIPRQQDPRRLRLESPEMPADWERTQLKTLEFVARAEGLALYGEVGCGKPTCAIGRLVAQQHPHAFLRHRQSEAP